MASDGLLSWSGRLTKCVLKHLWLDCKSWSCGCSARSQGWSAPLSIHHTPGQKHKVKRVGYKSVSHTMNSEVYEARNEQLRIRLWELGMIHDALEKIDQGSSVKNVAPEHAKNSGKGILAMFSNLLDVHRPEPSRLPVIRSARAQRCNS